MTVFSPKFLSTWKIDAKQGALNVLEAHSESFNAKNVHAYFRNNECGGSYWIEIREPFDHVRLIAVELQCKVNPLTLRFRVWFYKNNSEWAAAHKSAGVILLASEIVTCYGITPQKSWEQQLSSNNISLEGIEYTVRETNFLLRDDNISSGIEVLLGDLFIALKKIKEGKKIKLPHLFPEEVDKLEASYYEGVAIQVLVNQYERNRKARNQCLLHHGTACSVCGLNFAARYGAIGEEFIHVHHLRELSTIGEEYKVDPINDLIPVCPNCHAMLHQRRPAYSIEELKSIIKNISAQYAQ